MTTLTTWCLEMCPGALRLAAQANKALKRAAGFWTVQYTYHDDCIAATASATCEVHPYEYLSDHHDLGSTSGRLPCRQLGAVGSLLRLRDLRNHPGRAWAKGGFLGRSLGPVRADAGMDGSDGTPRLQCGCGIY